MATAAEGSRQVSPDPSGGELGREAMRDPRDPREVVVREGTHPNPGPGHGHLSQFLFLVLYLTLPRVNGGMVGNRSCCGNDGGNEAHDLDVMTLERHGRDDGVTDVVGRWNGTVGVFYVYLGVVMMAAIAMATCWLWGRARELRPRRGRGHRYMFSARRTGGRQPRRYDSRMRRLCRHRRSKAWARRRESGEWKTLWSRNCARARPGVGGMRRTDGGSRNGEGGWRLLGTPSARVSPDLVRRAEGCSTRKRLRARKGSHARVGLFKTVLFFIAMACNAGACRPQAEADLRHQPRVRHSWNMLADPELVRNVWAETEMERRGSGSSGGGNGQPPTVRDSQPAGGDEKKGGTTTTIISGNVHALGPRIGEVAQWEADILMRQETKLAPHAIKDATEVSRAAGWKFLHGRPCKVVTRKASSGRAPMVSAAIQAASGGVATMVKRPRKHLDHRLTDKETEMRDTGRWMKTCTATNGGGGILTTACYYGVSGANSCPRKHKHNEVLLSKAISLVLEAGDQPYLLIGDLNVDPMSSPAIAEAVDAGLLIDVGHMFAPDTMVNEHGETIKQPEPTYDKKGPMPGMSGPGVSRIDVALANPAAISAVKSFHLRWDLVQVDHVPIQIVLDMGEADLHDIVQRTRGDVDVAGAPLPDDEGWDAAYHEAHQEFGHRLQAALDSGNVDEAHLIWCYFAESCIKLAKGEELAKVLHELANSPPRGAPPSFVKKTRRKPVDRLGHPTTFRQRQATNIINKMSEIRNRLKKYGGDATASGVWEMIGGQNDLVLLVKLWTDASHRALGILGHSKIAELVEHDFPSREELGKMVNALRAQHERMGNEAKQERGSIRKAAKRWDWENQYGKRTFRASRIDYTPPTYSLRQPNSDQYYTSAYKIHEEFRACWSDVFSMHEHGGQERWEAFKERYGRYIPYAYYRDEPYGANEYVEQLKRMSDSTPGFDGWTRDALRSLLEGLWHWRAQVDNLAKRKGVVPSAYLHVPAPMIPKGHALDAKSHRGITIFSMIHRVTFGIEWMRLRTWQEQWISEDQHGGRIGGEHLADAWDLQGRIEAAEAEGAPLYGALLDYSKFFDRFSPDLVRGLFIHSGAPEGIANQLYYCEPQTTCQDRWYFRCGSGAVQRGGTRMLYEHPCGQPLRGDAPQLPQGRVPNSGGRGFLR